MKQLLASRGYIVFALNYRIGIGHGRAVREAPGRAGRGAAEYQDVVAAGKYLQSRSDVDAKHIGLWGGGYGGLFTALLLRGQFNFFPRRVVPPGEPGPPPTNLDPENIPAQLPKLQHDISLLAT